MNTLADIAAADEAEPFDPQAEIEEAEARLRDLAALRAMGMGIARTVHKQALAQEQLQDIGDRAGVIEEMGCVVTLAVRGDFGLVFSKVARAVRLTIAMEDKLAKELRQMRAAPGQARLAEAEVKRQALVRSRRAAVEQVMAATIRGSYHGVESLQEKSRERLGAEIEYEDFEGRPVSETVRRLCRSLGLAPDWDRWADEDWAVEEADAGVEGSPFEAREDSESFRPNAARKTGARSDSS